MLKRAFALSDQGAKDLAKGIIATACANLIQIIPASLLLMVVMMLLEKAAGTQVNVGRNIPFFVGITLVLFGMIAISQLVQYNLTYTAAYKESANRRIVLAEKLRKLPLSFFEKKNLADLTTTIMGDCTAFPLIRLKHFITLSRGAPRRFAGNVCGRRPYCALRPCHPWPLGL